MRRTFHTFRDSCAALKAAGYRCQPETEPLFPVVFGGDAVCVTLSGGEAYSDNGGRTYVHAELSVQPRWIRRAEYGRALKLACARNPGLLAETVRFPRSDAQARACLERAAELDRLAASLLPEAASELGDERTRAARRTKRAENDRTIREIAGGELAAEVLRLDGDGVLDSLALAGLKAVAVRIRALRDDPEADPPGQIADPVPRHGL